MKHKRGVISIALATIVLVSLCAVVCSASVTAADSSNTNVQAPSTVGAGLNSAPASAIWKKAGTGDNCFPAVAVKSSTDNQPYFTDLDVGGPTRPAWVALGGTTSDPPSIASGGPTQMVVSVRGNNAAGNLYWKETTDKGTTWLPGATGWNKVPTGEILAGTSPATYTFGANSIGWLVTGKDHQLYAMYYDGTNYKGWTKLGGYVTASPAVVTRGTSVDVYVRGNNGANGHIYQKSQNGGQWQTSYAERTTATNVKVGTAPTVSAYGTTREDLFWQGTDGLLYQSTWPNGADTSHWTAATTVATNNPAPGTTLASSPSATAGTINNAIYIGVYFTGANGHLWVTAYYTTAVGTPPTWQDTTDFAPVLGDGPP